MIVCHAMLQKSWCKPKVISTLVANSHHLEECNGQDRPRIGTFRDSKGMTVLEIPGNTKVTRLGVVAFCSQNKVQQGVCCS